MKYRQLLKEELEELEKEFIDFLVVNGITADDWVELKATKNEKAELIIDSFSDVVFESSMRKIKYLEFITPKSIKCFQCLDDKIVLVGVDVEGNSEIDFKSSNWKDATQGVKIYSSSKDYTILREKELFNMIQSGASISDGALFKNICLAL